MLCSSCKSHHHNLTFYGHVLVVWAGTNKKPQLQHIIQSGSTFYFTSRLIRIKPFRSLERGSSARFWWQHYQLLNLSSNYRAQEESC